MGHQRLSEYQIGLPLFKVNEPPKFQMSFCISTGETNTQYGLLCTVFHLYWCKMKIFGIFTAYWLWINGNQFDIQKALCPVCHYMKYDSFFSFYWELDKNGMFGLSVPLMMQSEEIWNFHGSLTLNKGNPIWYSGSLWYSIVSNMTHFFILFETAKNGLFWTICLICTDTKWRHLEFLWLTNFE